ncbi:MAG: hypothetical protein WCF77_02095 [Minisyncoccia bacterium]
MANIIVAGELYESITGQLFEIGRQLRQPNGYPFNAATLRAHLQAAIEGRFNGESFLRNTGELTICIPARKRPTLQQLQAKWPWIKKIERDTSPEGPVVFNLATVLRDAAEGSINGPEYERRLASSLSKLLGYQQLAWLVEHQDKYPVFMDLLGKIYVDFSGLVVVNGHDSRFVPCGHRNGERWDAYWDWLSINFHRSGRLAVSGE